MQRELIEYVHSQGLSLTADRQQGILRGVKILGIESRNGNRYSAAALRRALPLYEGIRVNVNHPPRGQEDRPRDYRDRIGKLAGVELRADGLYGALHFNPRHPLAEQLIWEAEHAPENVGFSHNAVGRGRQESGHFLVEEIAEVRSVDLVTDPATTRGLFESRLSSPLPTGASDMDLSRLTLDELEQQRADLVEQVRRDAAAAAEPALAAQLRELREELDRHRTAAALAGRREQALARCRRARLPDEALSEVFVASLLEAADEQAQAALIEDRRQLLTGAVRPQSKSPSLPGLPLSADGGRQLATLLKSAF